MLLSISLLPEKLELEKMFRLFAWTNEMSVGMVDGADYELAKMLLPNIAVWCLLSLNILQNITFF